MSQNPKILIVEDDEFFRKTLSEALRRSSFDVTEAPDGKIAKELLEFSPHDLILSDIQMPHVTGIDLLEWSKSRSSTKFVLMTGFSQILETKRAHELGADDFIAKPFSALQLLELVKKQLHSNQSEEQKEKPDIDKQFCKVSLEDFISSKETACAIFIRISNKKYIRIAHKGGKLSDERIIAYKEKGVQFVYVNKDDFQDLLGFNLKVAKVLTKNDAISEEKKQRFMKNTSEMILESVAFRGIDQQMFNETKAFLETNLDLISDDPATMGVLDLLKQHSDTLYAHGLVVSALSVMLGKTLCWTSYPTLFKLAMGGLFHDVGKKEIDPSILKKARALLTREERSSIESHCMRSKEILETLRTMPAEVVAIAYQHHEDMVGEGFPRRIQKNEIHPLAKVVQLANSFSELIAPTQEGVVSYSPTNAIQNLRDHKLASFDKEAFAALVKLFKES